jgi:thiamine biosynthesis lipoprotein
LLGALLTGCTRTPQPVLDSREALGTIVSVTAYGPENGVRAALDEAYVTMDGTGAELNAYNPDSPVGRFNAEPYQDWTLPSSAATIFRAVTDLGVEDAFSATLKGATDLWAFESGGNVPGTVELADAVKAAASWELGPPEPDGPSFRFVPTGSGAIAGLDFGGAAKGIALDYGREILGKKGAVDAALITAGSTTLTLGSKPDGEPWRIGIEDARDTGKVIATVETTGAIAVSTSGDYQRFFEVDGVRYHHILDPADGRPARGLRSLTVVGTHSGLESDILSTALFVMGPEKAIAYAEENGLGLYLVDDAGRTQIVPGPEDRSWEIVPAG